jgi:hypothetical protein
VLSRADQRIEYVFSIPAGKPEIASVDEERDRGGEIACLGRSLGCQDRQAGQRRRLPGSEFTREEQSG